MAIYIQELGSRDRISGDLLHFSGDRNLSPIALLPKCKASNYTMYSLLCGLNSKVKIP
jgi:hypothetical protein